MGTDMHLHVEVRDHDGEPWRVERGVEYEWRNYAVFAVLAGVRDDYEDITAIAQPRGLPDDVTEHTRGCLVDHDTHSCSWVTLAELLAYAWSVRPPHCRPDETIADACGRFCSEFMPALIRLDRGPDDVRIVFGFDS